MNGSELVDSILSHHGVKGMRWGRRKDGPGPTTVSTKQVVTRKGQIKVKAAGGTQQKPHADAVNAAKTKQVLKKSGTDALSNKDLQALSQRLALERQVKQLADPPSGTKKFITGLLADTGKQQARQVANDVAAREVKKMMAGK